LRSASSGPAHRRSAFLRAWPWRTRMH
jgi:hypothetical protein